jgi:hypothetical protein
MAGQGKLIAAIAVKLRTDTGAGSLVELTKHASGDMRIGRDAPPTKGKTPFLGIRVSDSPPISESTTMVQRARVVFHCYSTKEATALAIADRLEVLLHVDTSRTNANYYDFSSSDVSCRSTRYKDRNDPTMNKDTDVYRIPVEADVIWSDQPCPSL